MKIPLKTCMLSRRRINIEQFWKSIGEKVGDGCEKWKFIYFLCCPGIWGQSYISAPRQEILCFTENTQSWISLAALRSANIYQVSLVYLRCLCSSQGHLERWQCHCDSPTGEGIEAAEVKPCSKFNVSSWFRRGLKLESDWHFFF